MRAENYLKIWNFNLPYPNWPLLFIMSVGKYVSNIGIWSGPIDRGFGYKEVDYNLSFVGSYILISLIKGSLNLTNIFEFTKNEGFR